MSFVFGAVYAHGPVNVPIVTAATGTASRIVAAPLAKLDTGAKAGISLMADEANTATVYVGGPTCTVAGGFPIPVGGAMTFPVRDPYQIYAISGTAGQKLRVVYV